MDKLLEPVDVSYTELRFVAQVELLDDDCWLWRGGFQKPRPATSNRRIPTLWKGQGRLNGKMVFAHRYAYEKRIGELPNPRYFALLKTCDTEMCVNPRHFEVSSRKPLALNARPALMESIMSNPLCKNGLHERTPETTLQRESSNSTCAPCAKISQRERTARYLAKKKLAK
jgi:hypothetical protein